MERKEVTSLTAAQCISCQPSKAGIYNQLECYVTLDSSFTLPPGRFVTLMRPSPSGKCWVQYDGTNDVSLTDKTGSYAESFARDSRINGMDFQSDDSIIFCEGNCIKKALMPKRKPTTFVNSKSLIPRDLCASPDGDVIATLEDKDDFIITERSERVVVRYSQKGQEKARARYDHHGNTIFVRPNRIIITSTGDRVLVINYTDHGNSHIVILNANDLSLRLRYLGHGEILYEENMMKCTPKMMMRTPDEMTCTLRMQYAVTDIGLDVFDNIVMCEFYSRSVLLLTIDCEPLLTILPTQDCVPLLLASTQTDLWVGFENGAINVYTVHCNLEPETVDTHF